MRFAISIVVVLSAVLLSPSLLATKTTYSRALCQQYPDYYNCIRVSKGQSWEKLFPDPIKRDVVMRLNRVNIPTHVGMVIALPKNLDSAQVMDFAPFSKQIPAPGHKLVIVNPIVLAWGAYDVDGRLLRWGPASTGKSWCPDTGSSCRTVTGSFSVYRKGGAKCISTKFPLPNGGAPTPYCMFFHRGYALHASPTVPGYHDSHGCVRLFYDDAQWLNTQFVEYGTKVIVHPYTSPSEGT